MDLGASARPVHIKLAATAATVTLTLLSACMTLPVQGELEQTKERILGEATGYMGGSGTISIRLQGGTTCTGTFEYASSRVTGEGGFNCSDGRVGDFFFTSNGTQGEGFGKATDGQMFRFTFGSAEHTDRQRRQWQALADSFNQLSRTMTPTVSYCTSYGNSVRCTHSGY